MRPHPESLAGGFVLLLAALSLAAGCGKSATRPTPPPPSEYFVDASLGLDTQDGSSAKPFKTITRALAVAAEGMRIRLAPGTYDTTSGERFPLVMKAGQSLVGDTLNKGSAPGARVNVVGLGAIPGALPHALDQYATVLGAPGATVAGLRFGAPNEAGHFAVHARDMAVTVANNTFADPAYAGVFLAGSGASLVRGNVFHNASYGAYLLVCPDSVAIQDNEFILPAIPLDLVLPVGTGTVVRRNYIAGSGQVGIQVQSGTPLIDSNSFLKPGGYDTYGAIRCAFDNASPKVRRNQVQFCVLGVTILGGNPDLGTAGDPGLNTFVVTGASVRHAGSAAVSAIGNVWPNSPPAGGVDIVVTGTGSVRWGTGTGEIVP